MLYIVKKHNEKFVNYPGPGTPLNCIESAKKMIKNSFKMRKR